MSAQADAEARRDPGSAAFSYACQRCLRCCHDKLIQVNPYEAARLARRIGVSTTTFAAEHLEDGVFLRRKEDGSCEFLGPEGCTVHPDRPLVCRLYPLGRHVAEDGSISYSHHEPHPETEGVYGRDGTIEQFLTQQGVQPFAAAADRYLAILQRLFDAWRAGTADGGVDSGESDPSAGELLLDLDRTVAAYCAARGLPEPVAIEQRMELHLAAIGAWLEQ